MYLKLLHIAESKRHDTVSFTCIQTACPTTLPHAVDTSYCYSYPE